jgi:hypothetical protein
MNNEAAINLIKQAFDSPVWQAKKGVGSFLTFDMGKQIEKKKRDGTIYFQGSIHLWIYLCDWVIFLRGNEIADNNSEDSEIKEAVQNFIGKSIHSIQSGKSNELLIDFSDELSIKLNGNEAYSKLDDYFILYTVNGNVSYSEEAGLSVGELIKRNHPDLTVNCMLGNGFSVMSESSAIRFFNSEVFIEALLA